MANEVIDLIVAAKKDLVGLLGDSFILPLAFTDELGAPFDFTGASVRMQLKHEKNQAVPDFEFSTGVPTGIVITPPNQILIKKILQGIPEGRYHYDLEVTYAGGDIITYLEGIFNVISDTSRA